MELTGIKGAIALVTGAAQGVGAAVARGLAVAGATIAAVDRDGPALRDAVEALVCGGARARAYPAASTGPEVEALVERVELELGTLSILVTAAGLGHPGRLLDLDDETWEAHFAANARAPFLYARAVGRRMARRRRGTLVTVASYTGRRPRAGLGALGASQAAALALTRTLGLELAELGVRCNAVLVGPCEPPRRGGAAERIAPGDPFLMDGADGRRPDLPLGKPVRPVDVANAVLYLVSDQARQVTMHELRVDGGGE